MGEVPELSLFADIILAGKEAMTEVGCDATYSELSPSTCAPDSVGCPTRCNSTSSSTFGVESAEQTPMDFSSGKEAHMSDRFGGNLNTVDASSVPSGSARAPEREGSAPRSSRSKR